MVKNRDQWELDPHQIEDIYTEEKAGAFKTGNPGLRLLLYSSLLLVILLAAAGFIVRVPYYTWLPARLLEINGQEAIISLQAGGDSAAAGEVELQFGSQLLVSGRIPTGEIRTDTAGVLFRVEITAAAGVPADWQPGTDGQLRIQTGSRSFVKSLF